MSNNKPASSGNSPKGSSYMAPLPHAILAIVIIIVALVVYYIKQSKVWLILALAEFLLAGTKIFEAVKYNKDQATNNTKK